MSEPTAPPPPPAAPPPSAPSGSGSKTGMLVLSYLGLLALIPLLVEKDDPEVQWHAKHGLVQLVLFVIIGVAMNVIAITGIGALLSCGIMPFVSLAWLVIAILSIVKATKGERFLIPGISDFASKF